jgi:hydrogenase maturation protease
VRPRTVAIGIGNRLRGDDGAGIEVAERLRGVAPASLEVVACDAEPSRLMEAWDGADSVVLVDTVTSGAAAGTLHRFDACTAPVPARAFRSSTHAIGIADTIELARALGKLPRRVRVYGVEGADFDTGAGFTPAVEAALGRVVDAILLDLKEEPECTSAP